MLNQYAVLRFALLFLAAVAAANGQSFDRDILLDEGPNGAEQRSPLVRVAPDGTVFLAWTDFRNGSEGQVYLASSTDGGATFTKGRSIISGDGIQAGMQRGAQFVIDRSGVLHFVWQERNQLGKISARYARSTDRGLTFSQPVAVAADSGKHNQDFPSIAVDSSNGVYVAWIDDRDEANDILEHTQLYFAKSVDGGASFTAPVRASVMQGGSCECCNTSIAVSPGGHVYISFRANVDNNRDIHVARSLDGGTTFEVVRAASESWKINACPMSGSAIALDREETAHVVWHDARSSARPRENVYYTTLRYGDRAYAPDVRISNTPKTSNRPSIDVTPAGILLIAFQDNRTDLSDAYYVYSLDGGNTFSEEKKLSHESGSSRQDLPWVAIAPDGSRYAAWQDARRDAGDVVLGKDVSTLTPVRPAAVLPVRPLEGERLDSLVTFEWSAPGNLGDAQHVVYDLTYSSSSGSGEVPGLTSRQHMARLAPGDYLWHVVARTLVGASAASQESAFSVGGTSGVPVGAGLSFSLSYPVPHPIRAATGSGIRLAVPSGGEASVVLRDAIGRQVAVLFDGYLEAGEHTIGFEAAGLSSGIYSCSLRFSGRVLERTIVVVN